VFIHIHTLITAMPTATLECQAALSDLILQAARAAIPAHVDRLLTLPDSGQRNQPLLPLLVGLLDGAQATAKAIGDNAWDDCRPLNRKLALDLARQCRAIAADLENATECPDASAFSLPSMSGKEWV
jgi:hypothetical protein